MIVPDEHKAYVLLCGGVPKENDDGTYSVVLPQRAVTPAYRKEYQAWAQAYAWLKLTLQYND